MLLRNVERPRQKQLPEIRAMENPDEEFDIDQHLPNVKESEYLMNPSGYREVCWDLKKRGAVGESIFHLCLLNATSLHADLAKRLLKFYPKLINDIYMSDEYYGKSICICHSIDPYSQSKSVFVIRFHFIVFIGFGFVWPIFKFR